MKHSQKKRTGSKARDQSQLSRVLSSSNSRNAIVNKFFQTLEAGAIKSSIPLIANHRHFSNAINLPNIKNNTYYERFTPRTTIEKNIAWCLGLLEFHAHSIQFFLNREPLFLNFIKNNDVAGATACLDEIDYKCGLSTWSISLRGSLLSMFGMTESKRLFIIGLNESAGDNGFFKAVVRNISDRFDYGDAVFAESKFFEQKIKRSFNGEMLHFLMFKLTQNNFDFDYDFSHILNIEKNSSPIDIFKCLVDFLCYVQLSSTHVYKSEAIKVARTLNSHFKSKSLQGHANFYGICTSWIFEPLEYKVLDMYTEGAYEDVCKLMQEYPDLTNKFSLFEIWAKSICRVHDFKLDGYIGNLLNAVSSIMLKDERFDKSKTYLLSQTHAFSMLPWFRELHYLLARETSFISQEKNQAIENICMSLSEVNSPLKSLYLSAPLRDTYIEDMSQSMPDSIVVKLYKLISSQDKGAVIKADFKKIEPLRATKYLAKWYFDRGLFVEACIELEELRLTKDKIFAHDASRMLVSSYIELGKLAEAIDIYVQTVMESPSLMCIFDSEKICAVAELLVVDSSSISVPIALSLHSRFINDNYDATLKYSFERFLANNKVQSPIELFSRDDLPLSQINYFYEYVCTPEVMKLYLYFEGTRQIEECRIDVCKHLVDMLVSVESMVYEIKELTRRRVIMTATKYVENSRIYSDTSGFLHSSNDVRQLFDRFNNIRSNDYSNAEDEKVLIKFLTTFTDQPIIAENAHIIHLQDIVLNEKNATFLKIIKLMRDEFTFGDKGLNGYLSTRIRHGHFPNTLRKCVSDEGLVTSRISSSSSYKRNTLWTTHFSFLTSSELVEVDKAFSEFSSKFDGLINEVNDEWLQIYTFDQDISGLADDRLKEHTLFNYSVTAIESYYIQGLFPLNADYNDLVRVVTNWLWSRTEANLATIRERISGQVRDRAYRLLERLESDIFSIVGDQNNIVEFSDSVGRAKTKLHVGIETVIGWFSRSQGVTVTSYDLEIAVTIASLSAGAKLTHHDGVGMQFKGRTLSYLVDVFYLLLDNCVTKSLLSKKELEISTVFERAQGKVILSVNSNCLSVGNVAIANENLDFYRDSYGKEDFAVKASQGEGGTGFFKVWKALEKDLDVRHQIKFGYISESKFQVSISIDETELEKVCYHEDTHC